MITDYFSHLTVEEKRILKNKETEPPFTGEYNECFEAGIFICRACENPLYDSNTKFNSGCGWPSFDDEVEGAIIRYKDLSGDRERIEICCSNCDGHLGHVFKGEKMTEKDTRHCVNSLSIRFKPYSHLERATFGGGCFWSVEKVFSDINGVYLSQVGYMGGTKSEPTYKEVCSGKTNHAEVVDFYFDPSKITYREVLILFWENHNPTTLNRQGADFGTQYRSVIFYYDQQQKEQAEKLKITLRKNFSNDILTQIVPSENFYRAEEYHQKYLKKNKLGSCGI